MYTHLIEAQLLNTLSPDKVPKKEIELFGSIAESGEIFTHNNDNVRTDLLRFFDQLQFVQPPPSSFVVTGHHDLLLLNRQRQGLEHWLFRLKHRGIEAIIVLYFSRSN
jgi:hypothetical protein